MVEYEAMERKPAFTPWQVAVSEALRDGEAEKAIEAWRIFGTASISATTRRRR